MLFVKGIACIGIFFAIVFAVIALISALDTERMFEGDEECQTKKKKK